MRQWTIEYHETPFFHDCDKITGPGVVEPVLVVEKSAYDALLAQAEAMAEALQISDDEIKGCGAHRELITTASEALSSWHKFKGEL